MILTNAAAKIYLFNTTFWRQDVTSAKVYPASRCPQCQDSHVKLSGGRQVGRVKSFANTTIV